ncbi:MAG TPA: hypothetical protein VGC92_05550, partial [Phenylobacterium sp.]
LKEGRVSMVVSFEEEATDEAARKRAPSASAGLRNVGRSGQAHPLRTRQGRMVVMAVVMRETAHGDGPIAKVSEENHKIGVIPVPG